MTYFDTYYKGIFTGELPKFEQADCSERIAKFFQANGVGLRVVDVEYGPVVTKYICELETDHDRIADVEKLRRDLGLRLGVGASKVYIGESEWQGFVKLAIEVPNPTRIAVPSGVVIPSVERRPGELNVCLGVDTSGKPFSVNLAKAPHMLIAGQSGSGKSVFINSLVCGLLANYSYRYCRVSIVDPKGTEFNGFNGHISIGRPARPGTQEVDDHTVKYSDDAVGVVTQAVKDMESRMMCFKRIGVHNLAEATLHEDDLVYPFHVIVIDEFYDLMMTYGDKFAGPLSVLAAKARSAGIHLVLATQRPSADVIKGALKANLSTRIALKVASRTDSQVIIDQGGAESLCGKGDMLYCGPDGDVPKRLHGCMLTGTEIAGVLKASDTWYDAMCDITM